MKIAVFGATGMIGSRIVREALSRGHHVTGWSRSGGDVPQGAHAATGDLADPATVDAAAAGHDVLVSATGPDRSGGPHEPWLEAVQTLVDQAGGARVLFVGGAGALVGPGAQQVSRAVAVHGFDLDDFCAQVGQQQAAGRAHDHVGELDDADAGVRQGVGFRHVVGCVPGRSPWAIRLPGSCRRPARRAGRP